MATIVLLASGSNAWAFSLFQALCQAPGASDCCFREIEEWSGNPESNPGPDASYVYIPSFAGRDAMMPALSEAKQVLPHLARTRSRRLVLLSSALVYGTGTARQSLVGEEYATPSHRREPISSGWKTLEALAAQCLSGKAQLSILRPVTTLPSPALLSRRLAGPLTVTLAGHNPTLQLLSLQDLAEAVLCAVNSDREGLFNVAPEGVVPLHEAIRLGGKHRIPLPRTWQRLARRRETLDYLRYPWTVSNRKIKDELGFVPRLSSVGAIRESGNRGSPQTAPEPTFDEFGMDRKYIELLSKSVFRFLSDYYWRIETKGLERVPREGRGILVGTHRGFIPWDAIMTLHLLAQKTGRVPRYLTHPGLLKFPFISNFVTKMGGIVACQESSGRVLENDELLGVFPEGVEGAFTPYREAYKLRSFARGAFVKIALRHRAPIIPYVTVGNAEAYPIFGQIRSRRWTRYSDWPCLPVSTFPFLPLPLPSKWHIQFLPPIELDKQYGPEAAQDASLVKEISQEVRRQMQDAWDGMLRRRRSVFWGSVFEPDAGS